MKCVTCLVEKPKECFSKNKRGRGGRSSNCKTCSTAYDKEYSRTIKGVISKIYSHQKASSERREMVMPSYSKKELEKWILSQNIFMQIFDNWRLSGYKKSLKPSIDRLDDFKPYTFSNIQIITWGENDAKARNDKRNGAGTNGRVCHPVMKLTLDFEFITEYPSINEAARDTGTSDTNIRRCVKGVTSQAAGFIFVRKG